MCTNILVGMCNHRPCRCSSTWVLRIVDFHELGCKTHRRTSQELE